MLLTSSVHHNPNTGVSHEQYKGITASMQWLFGNHLSTLHKVEGLLEAPSTRLLSHFTTTDFKMD